MPSWIVSVVSAIFSSNTSLVVLNLTPGAFQSSSTVSLSGLRPECLVIFLSAERRAMVTISEPEGGSAAKKAMTGHDSGDHQGDWKSFDAYGFPPEAVAKETHKKLSWSRDNEESSDGFSDWKIVVTRDPSSTPSPYYAAEDGRKNAAASVSSTSLKRQETEEDRRPARILFTKISSASGRGRASTLTICSKRRTILPSIPTAPVK